MNPLKRSGITAAALLSLSLVSFAQKASPAQSGKEIDVAGFHDSSHHWYDIEDEDKIITPLPNQPKYTPTEIRKIADNILLFQKSNGGWPKNYDMLAILMEQQIHAVKAAREAMNTTFDNGATHSHVEYLARAFSKTRDDRYKDACLKGLDFILSAQYANGGWPQFYPDTSGYRKYITFNDGAMVGVMNVLHRIVKNTPPYSFVDAIRRGKARDAFERGLECILKCQVVQNGVLTGWGQQHDNVDVHPQNARTFEPASVSSRESAEIILLLMSIDHPDKEVVTSLQSAVKWLERSTIHGIRVKDMKAPTAHYKYQTVSFDRIVVKDSSAPPIWARLYELGTHRPLFCNRDAKPVYSLAEVDRERRTGYTWYSYEPDEVMKKYPAWRKKWSQQENVPAK